MKKNKILFLLIFLLIKNMVFASTKTSNNQIIAIVNNDVILTHELDEMIKIVASQANVTPCVYFNNEYLRHQILERLITNSMLSQKINTYKNIDVSNQQIDQEIFNISALHKVSLDQIRQNLMLNQVDYNVYRNTIKKEIQMTEALKTILEEKVNLVPSDIKTLDFDLNIKRSMQTKYNIDLIHIPVLQTYSKQDIAKQNHLVQNLMLYIKKNNTIDNLIVKNVDQSISKTEKIGWINIEHLPIIFCNFIMDAKKGDIIGPIKTNIGFDIFKIKNISTKQKKFFVDEIHVRHLMLKQNFSKEKQIKDKLEKIYFKIKNKKIKFDEASRILSEDIGSKNQGGDLGWYELNLFNSKFQNVFSKIIPGEISKPIYSMYGWHIFQLLEKRKINVTEEVNKQYAYQILLNKKIYEATQAWIEELRNNCYIKIFKNF